MSVNVKAKMRYIVLKCGSRFNTSCLTRRLYDAINVFLNLRGKTNVINITIVCCADDNDSNGSDITPVVHLK